MTRPPNAPRSVLVVAALAMAFLTLPVLALLQREYRGREYGWPTGASRVEGGTECFFRCLTPAGLP